jgi:hypothetical protein
MRASIGRTPIRSIRARADDRQISESTLQWKKALRCRAPAPVSQHLLNRGPARKLTRGWVKIVVDIDSRALRTSMEKSKFICLIGIRPPNVAVLVPTYYRATESFILMFQNGSNKNFLGHVLRRRKNFAVAPAYRISRRSLG